MTISIGFGGLLGIVFIVLKLIHVIDWTWVWVVSPIWISIALDVAILIIWGIVRLVIAIMESRMRGGKK